MTRVACQQLAPVIGDLAESGFLMSGLPCRLAQGRALGEDPVCEYVVAALGAILHRDIERLIDRQLDGFVRHDDFSIEMASDGHLIYS